MIVVELPTRSVTVFDSVFVPTVDVSYTMSPQNGAGMPTFVSLAPQLAVAAWPFLNVWPHSCSTRQGGRVDLDGHARLAPVAEEILDPAVDDRRAARETVKGFVVPVASMPAPGLPSRSFASPFGMTVIVTEPFHQLPSPVYSGARLGENDGGFGSDRATTTAFDAAEGAVVVAPAVAITRYVHVPSASFAVDGNAYIIADSPEATVVYAASSASLCWSVYRVAAAFSPVAAAQETVTEPAPFAGVADDRRCRRSNSRSPRRP